MHIQKSYVTHLGFLRKRQNTADRITLWALISIFILKCWPLIVALIKSYNFGFLHVFLTYTRKLNERKARRSMSLAQQSLSWLWMKCLSIFLQVRATGNRQLCLFVYVFTPVARLTDKMGPCAKHQNDSPGSHDDAHKKNLPRRPFAG